MAITNKDLVEYFPYYDGFDQVEPLYNGYYRYLMVEINKKVLAGGPICGQSLPVEYKGAALYVTISCYRDQGDKVIARCRVLDGTLIH